MKLLVVGLGSIGSRHAANAAALNHAETAVFDPVPGLAESVGARLGVPFFSDWRAALGWTPEAAVVAAPTDRHLPTARALVAAGAHVLVEKPIADSLDGVDAFLDEAENRGRKVFVACNMRFHPAIEAVRRELPRIGRPLYARAHYGSYLPDMRPGADYRRLYCARRETGGGVILDAIHEIDYLSWLFGPVETVACEAARLSDLEIDVEDWAELSVRHQSGVRTQTHLDYLRRFKRRGLEIAGTEGSILWLSEGKNPEHCRVRLHGVQEGWTTLFEDEALDAAPMYAELMRRFVLAITGDGDEMLLNGREAREELAATLAALRAAAEGRIVPLAEFKEKK